MNKKKVSNKIFIVLVAIVIVLIIALMFSYFNKPSEEKLLKEILEAEANSKQGSLATLTGDEGPWCDGNDVNRDGFVSFGDVSLVFSAFKSGIYSEVYDVQKDGFISFGDVSKVFSAFKSGDYVGGCSFLEITRTINELSGEIYEISLEIDVNENANVNAFIIREKFPLGWILQSYDYENSAKTYDNTIEWLGSEFTDLNVQDSTISYIVLKTNENNIFEGEWLTLTPEGREDIGGENLI